MNTLTYAKKMKKAGFSQKQAEGQALLLNEIVQDMDKRFDKKFASKKDLRSAVGQLRSEIKQLELRMTVKLGMIVVGSSGVLFGMIALLLKA